MDDKIDTDLPELQCIPLKILTHAQIYHTLWCFAQFFKRSKPFPWELQQEADGTPLLLTIYWISATEDHLLDVRILHDCEGFDYVFL